jgi:signal transduction histidine kinase
MGEDQIHNTNGMDDGRLMFIFAHDLRTHLRTVRTRIQLVQRGGGALLPAEEQIWLEEAAAAVGQIDGLLSALVGYCDADAGDGVLGLRLVLQGALIERKGDLVAAGGEVELQNDLDLPVPGKLQGVLKELLTNACKFRDPSRALRIRIATRLAEGDNLEITVKDNGLGVAPAYLERIFEPFQHLHPRDRFPGYGLGLATCRRLATVWGGSVTAQSADEGLTVRISVPAAESLHR